MQQTVTTIWIRISFSIVLGILLTLSLLSRLVLADAPDQPTMLSEPPRPDTPNPSPLPFTYARVVTDNVLVYETSGITPVRSLGPVMFGLACPTPSPSLKMNKPGTPSTRTSMCGWINSPSLLPPPFKVST